MKDLFNTAHLLAVFAILLIIMIPVVIIVQVLRSAGHDRVADRLEEWFLDNPLWP